MKDKLFFTFDIIVYLLSCQLCLGQTTYLSNVIPPSPESSALFDLLDYPPDLSTGQVKINIPIYDLECGDLKVPISISYNASGRQVFEQTGPLGVGWSLNAGGEIARTIYGKPDDDRPFVPTVKLASNISNQNDYDYLANIYYYDNTIGGNYDSEFDIFSFYFGNKSGRFVIDRTSSSGKVPYMSPRQPIKIEESTFPSYIVDDDGTTYNFTQLERYDASGSAFGQPITGKLLTSIISADKKDTIFFSYQSFYKISRQPSQRIILLDDVDIGPCSTMNNPTSNVENDDNYYPYYIQRLTTIKCRNQTVKFTLDGTSDRIKDIEIRDQFGILKKKIGLQMSVIDIPINGSTESTYSLDKIVYYDDHNNEIDNYSFEYNSSTNFLTSNRDYYGFLNGTSQTNLIPTYEDVNVIQGFASTRYSTIMDIGLGANRKPNSNMKKSILSSIIYPTGGSTSFSYEVNQYKLGNDIYEGRGLRISQITTDDGNGNSKIKTYKYGVNEYGYGTAPLDHILARHMSSESRFYTSMYPNSPSLSTKGGYRQRVYSSEFLPEIGDLANQPVYYDVVTEYEGTVSNNIGKKIYQYDWPAASTSTLYSLDYYPLPMFPGLLLNLDFSSTAVDATLQRPYIREYNLWNSNDLINLSIYKNTGNNTYTKVKSFSYNYDSQITKSLMGLKIYKYLTISNCSSANFYSTERGGAEDYHLPVFMFVNYNFNIGEKQLQSVIETDYQNATLTSKIIEYTYNNLLKESTTEMLSNGDKVTTHYRYPLDYAVGSVPSSSIAKGIKRLQDGHIINAVVEQFTQRSNSGGSHTGTIAGRLTTYKQDLPVPDIIYAWQSSSPSTSFIPATITGTGMVKDANYKPAVSFDTYDTYGNILQQHKTNDVNHSYIWDYQQEFPIAEVNNAANNDIAYTSFEADGKGNWSFNGVPSAAEGSITGSKSYALSSGAISRSGLNSSGKYIVSYWLRSGGSVNISGGSQSNAATGKTVNNWTYHEVTISGAGSISLSGTGYIDELRLYPSDAQMATYTYDPLIGMTSHTDLNNSTAYYEYDPFGRLSVVKDQDGKILKKYCYNYAGQPVGCNIYKSDAINGDYYSQHCPTGQTPVAYHVTVPQGQFVSYVDQQTANQLAQDYAQSQANEHGSCVVLNVSIYAENNHGVNVTVQLHAASGQNYTFTSLPHSGEILGEVPPGTYDITLTPQTSGGYYSCSVGCGYYNDGTGVITFYGISISAGCNSITID